MWRCDAGRTGTSPQSVPEQLHLVWTLKLPPLVPAFWQQRQERLGFDAGYEPVVLGKRMFIGSNRNDSVIALDTETGNELWRFFADGPIRFAPVAWEDKLYVGSDDGQLYCLGAADGRVAWKIRVPPSNRKVIGNGRLISVWPVRGGPVVADGVVYFAAGIWPFEGVFVCAADARTGKALWVNDRTGSMYVVYPHNAPSFGGPSPQGYLLVRGDELVVPCGRAFPAFFDRHSGKLDNFDFGHGGWGSRPGSWFVVTDAQSRLCVDSQVNTEMHDEGQQIIGQRTSKRKPGEVLPTRITIGQNSYEIESGIRQKVSIGGHEYDFGRERPPVRGPIHSILAADDKLFVVSREGEICCFSGKSAAPVRHEAETQPLQPVAPAKAKAILDLAGRSRGYAIVLGIGDGSLVNDLVGQSELHVIAIDADPARVAACRSRFDKAGLYGQRIAAHVGNLADFDLPQYLARLIVCEDPSSTGLGQDEKSIAELFRALRPYGGAACLGFSESQHAGLAAGCAKLAGLRCRREGGFSVLVREGPLPGSSDFTGAENFDQAVAAPLGLLWFGDTFHHHKLFWKGQTDPEGGRGLPTDIKLIGGILKYTTTTTPYGPKPGKDFLKTFAQSMSYVETFTDVYTGRVMDQREAAAALAGKAASAAAPADLFARHNPLTGILESREFLKSHGCDLYAVDYGNMMTLRSGTAAFYDCRLESGLVNISGIRSGCRNSIVPGDGVLALPSWTGNCSCNYPIFTSLALAPMPETYEQWAAWGGVAVEAPIRRLGVNLGAPGDRMTRDGTLWVNYPGVGGPSPNVPIQVVGDNLEYFYRHALWIRGGEGWPWVVASGVKGVRSIRIEPLARRSGPLGQSYSVRWSGFLQPPASDTYTFHVNADYGYRLWVGDTLVVDHSLTVPPIRIGETSGTIVLEAGRKYPVRLEYFHAKAIPPKHGFIQVQWSRGNRTKEPIPSAWLFTPAGAAGALTGAYYDHPNLLGPGVLHDDASLSLDWADQLPRPLTDAVRPVQLAERPFTVRLYFAEPENLQLGQRVFDVRLQGHEGLKNVDIVRLAGGVNRGMVTHVGGVIIADALDIEFVPSTARPPLICGIELIEETSAVRSPGK
jgi:hypothetical protein